MLLSQKTHWFESLLLLLYITLLLIETSTIVGGSEDYYEILGVKKNADNREIRRAFKKLAMTNHPDKNKDDPDAHDKFVKINKAYEILKDDETRKKYDLYGEEGLKDTNANSWKGNFHSWRYYSESFGIYDEDLEIITLNKNEFEKSVLNAPDVWFVNFYSPQCSHCHQLAPAWRTLARELEGVIRIGAVNCEEDWVLCRNENVWSYPSLILYPQKIKYQGSRESDHMVEYVLEQLPYKVLKLTASNFETIIQEQKYPWLISFCTTSKDCLFKDDLKKLGIMMDGLVTVAAVDCNTEKSICDILGKTSGVALFPKLSSKDYMYNALLGVDNKDIAHAVLQLLPDVLEVSKEKYDEIKDQLKAKQENPWLLYFKKDSQNDEGIMRELKRLSGMLPDVNIGQMDCTENPTVCTELYIQKFPVFLVLKHHSSYEIHHGRATAHDIAVFTREAIYSNVETLTSDVFPSKVILKDQPWLVDFFAPWCPPCMHLLPEVRKASRIIGHKVRFGTIDCTIHSDLCSKYNIRNYPTTILYNETTPHIYYGTHSHKELVEFIQDILSPPVIDLTPSTFSDLIENKNYEETWVVDYFAPWCRPCQQLGVQWRKLAKMLSNDSGVYVASVNCQTYRSLCHNQGVHSYPDIRLYPGGSEGTGTVNIYNDWNRDAISLRAWVYSFLPSTVLSLSSSQFFKTVLSDKNPWVIDFYAPWCGHCQVFAPEFEIVSKKLSGKVKAGKINCDSLPHVCQQADVHAYPTVRFYSGSTRGRTQSPIGQEINSQQSDVIVSFITQNLRQTTPQERRDEL